MAGVEVRWAFNAMAWQPHKSQLLSALSYLTAPERDRIERFRFKGDYKLCLIGRLMIRRCVNLLLGIQWKDILLERSDKGKPELANDIGGRMFSFNVSHQGDYTVLAASNRFRIGVDVMKYVMPNNTDIPSFFRLMKRQFADIEWDYVRSFSDEWIQLKVFYRLWCLKESYVKALGVGIGTDSAATIRFETPTDLMNQTCKCADSVVYVKNVQLASWRFHETLLDNDHVVSVALETGLIENMEHADFELISLDSLLDNAQVIVAPHNRWWDCFNNKYTKI